MQSKKTSAKQKKRKSSKNSKAVHKLILALVIVILILAIIVMAYLVMNSQSLKKDSRLAEAEANRAAQAEEQAAEDAEEEAAREARVAAYQAEVAAAASAAEAAQTAAPDTAFEGTPVPDTIADSSAEDVIPAVRSNSQQLTISFAGDCALSGSGFESSYAENGASYFLQNVSQFFEHDDLTVVNLESPLTTSEDQEADDAYRSDPSYVQILTGAGIDCVNLANAHSHDYGDTGYSDTKATLSSAGIDSFGDGETSIVTVKGVKIGFSGIDASDSALDHEDEAIQNIQDLKKDGAEIVICEFYWPTTSKYTPSSAIQQLAHDVIDAGADLIVGFNAKTIQGIELYEGKYICYSLGNLCYGGSSYYSVSSDYYSMIFQVTFLLDDGEVQDDADFTIVPCTIGSTSGTNDYCPTPASGTLAENIMDLFYDTICGYIGSEYTIDANTPNQTVIWNGGTTRIGYTAADDADAADASQVKEAVAADDVTAGTSGTGTSTSGTGTSAAGSGSTSTGSGSGSIPMQ